MKINNNGISDKLEKGWNTITQVLLGEPLYELQKYEKWLSKYIELPEEIKEVPMPHSEYPKNARFQKYSDVNWNKKYEPLNINEIKDIDSIAEAIRERILDRVIYTGEAVFGNSASVSESSSVFDSMYVYKSARVVNSSYVAYSSKVKGTNYAFGVNLLADAEFGMKSYHLGFDKRVFESSLINGSNDVYYSFGLKGCNEAMFSFNLLGKQFVIGNRVLSKDKYLSIKQKLLEQIHSELESKKEIFSLIDIVNVKSEIPPHDDFKPMPEEPTNKDRIEQAFKQTTKIIFGKEWPGSIDDYAGYLIKHTHPVDDAKSPMTGRKMVVQHANPFILFDRSKILKKGEGEWLALRLKLSEDEINKLDVNNIVEIVGKIAYVITEERAFENSNLIDVAVGVKSRDCYRGCSYISNKFCGYSYWPRSSEYMFGSAEAMLSSFGINVYYSDNIRRGFEVDTSYNSTDVYFVHNVDKCTDCMFTFNAKGLRNSIGNVEYEKSKYLAT